MYPRGVRSQKTGVKWDYRGSGGVENEEEARERGLRMGEWIREFASSERRVEEAHRQEQAGLTGDGNKPLAPVNLVLAVIAHQTFLDLLTQVLVAPASKGRAWCYGGLDHKLKHSGVTTLQAVRCSGSAPDSADGKWRIISQNQVAGSAAVVT